MCYMLLLHLKHLHLPWNIWCLKTKWSVIWILIRAEKTVHNLQWQFNSDHHPAVSVLVGVVDECSAEHLHCAPLLLYSYLCSEHSLLSLLSLHWLKARGPQCASLLHSTFTRVLFTHFLLDWLIEKGFTSEKKWLAVAVWQCKYDFIVHPYRFSCNSIIIQYITRVCIGLVDDFNPTVMLCVVFEPGV